MIVSAIIRVLREINENSTNFMSFLFIWREGVASRRRQRISTAVLPGYVLTGALRTAWLGAFFVA